MRSNRLARRRGQWIEIAAALLLLSAVGVVVTSCSGLHKDDAGGPEAREAESQMTSGSEASREPPVGAGAATSRDLKAGNRAQDDRLYEIGLLVGEAAPYRFIERYSSDQLPVILEALMIVVQDEDARPDDRVSAGRVLGLMQRPEAFEPLMAMLAEPRGVDQSVASYYYIRNNVIRALGDLGDPRAVPVLTGALADGSSVYAGGATSYFYYEGGQPLGFRRVPWRRCHKVVRGMPLGHASGVSERTAVIAAESLGEIGSEQAVPALINVLQDGSRDSLVRLAAGSALGQIGDPRALPALRALREDRNERRWFGESVGTCISHIESRLETPEQLVSDLGSDDTAAVCFAIDRLVRLRAELAVPALEKLYDDPRMFMFPGRPHTTYTIRYLAREAVRDIRAGAGGGS